MTYPIVLLHGFCEDKSLWTDLLSRLDHVPALALDLPGFGDAPLPARAGMDFLAHSVCEALNVNAIERCVMIGHSMGGYAALAFAALYPERLAGLSLVHSHPYADAPERLEARARAIDMIRSGKKDLYVSQLFPGLFPPAYAAENPDVLSKLIENGKMQPAEGIANALVSMMERRDHCDTLQKAKCVVQMVLGTEDALIPYDTALKAACLPAICSVELMPAVGHMSMFEAPERLAEVLEAFWRLCNKV